MEIQLLNGKIEEFDISQVEVGENRNFDCHHTKIPGLFWPKLAGDKIIFVRPDVAHMETPNYDYIIKSHYLARRVPKNEHYSPHWYISEHHEKKQTKRYKLESMERFAKFILLNWPDEAKNKMEIGLWDISFKSTVERASVGIFEEQ